MRTAATFFCLLFALLLGACTGKSKPPPLQADNLKLQLFKSLLDRGPQSAETRKLREQVKARSQDRLAALPETVSPSVVELDMIVHAQDLKPAEREEVIRLYRAGCDRFAELSDLIAKAKAGHDLVSLQQLRESEVLRAMEKIAELLRGSTLDRDYAYRAILREQRRNGPGFFR